MKKIREQEFIQKYNQAYGRAIGAERKKRKLTLEKLSAGIMSRTMLDKVEKGIVQWTKVEGDTLMLRMGIPPEYFESLASGEDLERWRQREDICLLVPGQPEEAAAAIDDYRQKYKKREPLEEQFLLKAEVILMLERQRTSGREDSKVILDTAIQAVDCTVPDGWKQGMESLCLSPGELDAVLLVSAALFQNSRREEAWQLWQAVWEYPGQHCWRERVMVMVLPQAAVLGIRMASVSDALGELSPNQDISLEDMAARGAGSASKGWEAGLPEKGWEALELLRRNGCHCYVLPLLDCLYEFEATLFDRPEYLDQIKGFRKMFLDIYEWFDYPGYRIWQGISVDNIRDAGMTLKMLRKCYGKSRENAVYDGDELIMTSRQLERIEKGLHKPSYSNYDRLVKQYGKFGGWNMPLLETDSLEVLEQRQLISTLMECRKWDLAEWEIEKFRHAVNPDSPRVRQELLFFEAVLKQKKGGDLQECLEILLEALRCTVPDFEGKDMKWWVYQREEIMIASNIGSFYRRLGNLDEAKKWLEAVLFSIDQNSFRTGIYHYGFDIAYQNYDNYLSNIHSIDNTVEMGESIIEKLLLLFKISSAQDLFYHIAWNAYEIAGEKPEEYVSFRQIWEKAFRISELMSGYMYDSSMKTFLTERESKYLS
ncbi:MAG: hypothetical protein HFH85_02795 [Lachnospiraceae bacterium]|jgi:tetratricopeptide (TPR) repeat protein|nr:hypothetical protein [Lachnospiraceae bacterium]